MSKNVIRGLLGTVNGVNRDFTTPTPYVPGTVAVYLNGQLKTALRDDGWEEMGYDRIRMRVAPQVGDVLQAFFTAQL